MESMDTYQFAVCVSILTILAEQCKVGRKKWAPNMNSIATSEKREDEKTRWTISSFAFDI